MFHSNAKIKKVNAGNKFYANYYVTPKNSFFLIYCNNYLIEYLFVPVKCNEYEM